MAFAEYRINGMMGAARLACRLSDEDADELVSVQGMSAPRWIKYAVEMLRMQAMVEAARTYGINIT